MHKKYYIQTPYVLKFLTIGTDICMTSALLSISDFAHANEPQCSPKQHASVPVITNMTYHKARKILLAKGWQPLQTKNFNTASDDPDIAYGNGKKFWAKGYVEVEACAGTGTAPCAFLFKDVYGTTLRLFTLGEEIPESKAFARVSGFRFICN